MAKGRYSPEHTVLTLLILYLNRLLDSGRFDGITVEEVGKAVEDGTLCGWLKERTGMNPCAQVAGSDIVNFEEWYIEQLQRLWHDYGTSRWGVENRGLCALIAWTNEIVQQGTGWRPGS